MTPRQVAMIQSVIPGPVANLRLRKLGTIDGRVVVADASAMANL